MKAAMKILAALAAALGAICVLSLYGEKIVAWCKKVVVITTDAEPEVEEVIAEEPAAEEAAPVEEVPAEEVPVEECEVEIVVENNEPVAEEADFEA